MPIEWYLRPRRQYFTTIAKSSELALALWDGLTLAKKPSMRLERKIHFFQLHLFDNVAFDHGAFIQALKKMPHDPEGRQLLQESNEILTAYEFEKKSDRVLFGRVRKDDLPRIAYGYS